jgi:hypothetical protein
VSCIDCTDEIDHCHAVWIRHADGHEECLAIECRAGADAHLLVVTCFDIDHDCCG